MSIGENIKKYRDTKGFTKEELSLRSRIGVQVLESYENNERVPELDTILKISTVLDIPASELMESEENEKPDEELLQLIQKAGTKRAKFLLRKTLDFSEEDILKAINLLYELNKEKN
ncbi:helix-turn-helix domain-containing protein [Halobacillus massiliensis]|uniref:helix-turn-helix domain-containing protein n=1 Tax=Halobacillus massiliensis TaxID=1926286 RepID=UPI0009E32AD3|nr:helix-turn-helix transcriptional regulator [Halobacillus massiliensis]